MISPGVIHLLLKNASQHPGPRSASRTLSVHLCTSLNGSWSLLGSASSSVLPGFLRASVSRSLISFLVQTWSPPPATLAVPSRPGGAEW